MFVKVGSHLLRAEQIKYLGVIETSSRTCYYDAIDGTRNYHNRECDPCFDVSFIDGTKVNISFDTIEEAREAWAKLGEALTSLQ